MPARRLRRNLSSKRSLNAVPLTLGRLLARAISINGLNNSRNTWKKDADLVLGNRNGKRIFGAGATLLPIVLESILWTLSSRSPGRIKL